MIVPPNTIIHECDEAQAEHLINRFGGDWAKTDELDVIAGGFWTTDATELDYSDIEFLVTVVGADYIDENRENVNP